MKHIALIADIVDSRKIKDRAVFQKQLGQFFTSLSAERKDLASPFTITLGDEFQALYQAPEKILSDIWTISAQLYPQKARFALGIGEITTEVNSKEALGMDGPAFHLARDLLTDMKKSGSYLSVASDPAMNHANLYLRLISTMMDKWQPNRFRILNLYVEGMEPKRIAGELDMSVAAVYKNISDGALPLIDECLKVVISELKRNFRKGSRRKELKRS